MDVIIVGGGLAGLHCALRISEKSKQKILLLESYSEPGGRVSTFTKGKLHWEAGAGRIPHSHPLIASYCERYSLTRFPISRESMYMDGPTAMKENIWDYIVKSVQSTLSGIPKSVLGHYTMAQILYKLYDKETADTFLSYFPYRSEMTTMRSDLAFSKEFSSAESFYGIKEGLSALIDGMVRELRERGVTILCNHRVTGMAWPTVHCSTPGGVKSFSGKKIIFALHANALRTIRPFTGHPILNHLKMTPLYRIYSIFPVGSQVWFQDLPRIVTDGPLRHIIPINASKGLIMTSYTDAEDTVVWNRRRKNGTLDKTLMKELRSLLPLRDIPNPLSVSSHYWEHGCTYWTPGSYDPVKESNAIMQPFPTRFPDVYVCGESFSLKQAWMEGALEHADTMLNKFFFRAT
jgi:glycine/D-amino acid oxidase-like deaminating enzyme